MALTGSQKAYTYARSGLARSGATRSNYVTAVVSTVDLIVRDGSGNIISRTDITLYIRHGSLQVTQALNDEPDTCSFQIVPTAPPEAVPQVGQEIPVAWTPGDVLFRRLCARRAVRPARDEPVAVGVGAVSGFDVALRRADGDVPIPGAVGERRRSRSS